MLVPRPEILRESTEMRKGGLVFKEGVSPTEEQEKALRKYNEEIHKEMVIIED